MKRKLLINSLAMTIIISFAGCGGVPVEVSEETILSESTAFEEESPQEVTEETTVQPAEESAEAESVEEEATESASALEEDSTVYGNTAGNIMGGGLLLEDDDYFYLYHGYDNCVYKTNKKTGISDRLVDGFSPTL